ncbi:efflux RND transporter periplasmic adaptor subunit [Jannaschia aquimarina]|uniref:MdtA_1 protein n=1 Tax=Jannaschia aquimarina TaxID=935700 RepID=A0A0D1DAF2_9RHOB|nr:efflux RND transporter periplasmic adaptor subunit [Jannaschia aquimarina]KIT16898.1 Multidrug resistance protein MdtA precursor [Jannaschia aquimarina]SNT12051.1 RND family efflux transporter, MFP subunit [Jannaschia aquimarina]
MSFDFVFLLILIASLWLGALGGLLRMAAAAVLLAAAGLAALAGQAGLAMAGLGLWVAAMVVLGMIRRPASAGRGMRLSGAALGLAQAGGAILLLPGLLLGGVYRDAPDAAQHLRGATVYGPIAGIAHSVALGSRSGALAYPAPLAGTAAPREAIVPMIDWAAAMPFGDDAIRALPGQVRALDRAPLAFEVDGRVSRVTVDIGERFEEGDVLAELDTHLLEIALQERRAALIEAEARLEESRQEFDRQSVLFARGVVSEALLETVQASLDAARSRHEIALRGIETAQDRLNDATLRAPYDGSVAARLVEPAQTVASGRPVLEIQSNGGGFEITATVPDTVVSRLRIGTEHDAVLLDGSEATFTATLRDIGARSISTAGFPVTLSVRDAEADLRTGMSLEIAFRLANAHGGTDLLAIPVEAIAADADQGHTVFRVDAEDDVLRRVPVVLAGTEGGLALVSDGLEPGDRVATRGIVFLEDGQRVRLRGTGVARYDQ